MKWKEICAGHQDISYLKPCFRSWFTLSALACQSQIIYIVMHAGIADIHQDTTVGANRYVMREGHLCVLSTYQRFFNHCVSRATISTQPPWILLS